MPTEMTQQNSPSAEWPMATDDRPVSQIQTIVSCSWPNPDEHMLSDVGSDEYI
jgi:hypothetical protein